MDVPHPYEEDRPWGSFRRFTNNELSTVKILTVRGGEAFSLQVHAHRSEFWRILSGECRVTVGDAVSAGKPGDEFFVAAGAAHRIEGVAETQVLEIAYGAFDENDITRLSDKYGRTTAPSA